MKNFIRKNFGFTPQERLFLYLFIGAFTIGLALKLFTGVSSDGKTYDYTSLDAEFQTKSVSVPESVWIDSSALLILNSITKDELMEISSIGPVIAERIIEYRRVKGLFESIDGLIEVSGIGEKRFQTIKHYLKTLEKK